MYERGQLCGKVMWMDTSPYCQYMRFNFQNNKEFFFNRLKANNNVQSTIFCVPILYSSITFKFSL